MKRVLKSFGMEAGQMEKSKDDIWCGLSKFLSEIIEKYAENLEKDLRGKNSTSIITVRKIYSYYKKRDTLILTIMLASINMNVKTCIKWRQI